MFSVFFSNRIEVLFDHLKERLFAEPKVFSRRLIVVPSPIMKTWINWQMANDPGWGISMGLEFCYVNEAASKIMKKYYGKCAYLPSQVEIALALDAEIRSLLRESEHMGPSELLFWQPLFHYLGNKVGEHFTKKNERKLFSLADHLAHLFQLYGMFAGKMLKSWEMEPRTHWQQELWHRIFCSKNSYSYLSKEFQKFDPSKKEQDELQIHLFAISFLPKAQFDFFSKLGKHIPLHYYIHSPCQAFWSDLHSDKEACRLQRHWQKLGISLQGQDDFYLMDRNALLANSGKLGRETAKMFEDYPCRIVAQYVVQAALLKDSSYRNLISEEILVDDQGKETSLLKAVQADMALLRPSDPNRKIEIFADDRSIQVHIAVSRMREMEILYNNLMQLMKLEKDNESPIRPSDIIVMAPDISQYEGFIKAVFLRKSSCLDIQIYDVEAASSSLIAQGYSLLLGLAQSRWEPEQLFRFFRFPQIRKKFDLGDEEIQLLHRIVKESSIRWGIDGIHRQKCLPYPPFEEELQSCVQTSAGTWSFGIHRAFLGVVSQLGEQLESIHSFEASVNGVPLESLDFAQAEALGKWAKILKGMYRDLKPLSENISMPLNEWVWYLTSLLEAYFSVDMEDEYAVKAYQSLMQQIAQLAKCKTEIQKNDYSWFVIEGHLKDFLRQDKVIYRENHMQAVRFCSMLPMRAVPAKVICLIGMNEEAFPKKSVRDPMNLMAHFDIDYCPKNSDYDRYLFLEALLSARRYLIMSYVEEKSLPAKQTNQQSVLIAELLGYLDERYEMKGKQVSDYCLFRHPFHSFDPAYFKPDALYKSYFERDYMTASAYCNSFKKRASFSFFPSKLKEPSDVNGDQVVDIKDLISFAKNPLKYFFNQSLGIYFDQEERSKEKEEFQLSALDQYFIRHLSHTEEIASVLSYYRKMGKLPTGVFEEISEKKIYEKHQNFREALLQQRIICDHFVDVNFDLGVQEPTRVHDMLWKVPSIELLIENQRMSIVGRIKQISPDGLWVYGESKPEDLYRHWPEILLANMLEGISKKQAVLLKSGAIVSIDVSGAKFLFTQWVKFYRLCSTNLPLLIPEFASFLLFQEAEEFKKSVQKYVSAPQSFLFNPYAKWVFKNMDFESLTNEAVMQWRNWASEIYGDHIRNILDGQ